MTATSDVKSEANDGKGGVTTGGKGGGDTAKPKDANTLVIDGKSRATKRALVPPPLAN